MGKTVYEGMHFVHSRRTRAHGKRLDKAIADGLWVGRALGRPRSAGVTKPALSRTTARRLDPGDRPLPASHGGQEYYIGFGAFRIRIMGSDYPFINQTRP